jgi:hypothetical protein
MIKQSLCPSCSSAIDKLPTTSAKPPVFANGEISDDITPIFIGSVETPFASHRCCAAAMAKLDEHLISPRRNFVL